MTGSFHRKTNLDSSFIPCLNYNQKPRTWQVENRDVTEGILGRPYSDRRQSGDEKPQKENGMPVAAVPTASHLFRIEYSKNAGQDSGDEFTH
jgi:hypothetical protein